MDFTLICRTCLCSGSLNPLFNDDDDHDTFSKTMYMATGIQVCYNDNLPQNICNYCIIKLNDALKFRQACKNAEVKLLKQINTANICNEGNGTMVKTEVLNTLENNVTLKGDKPLELLRASRTCNSQGNSVYIKSEPTTVHFENECAMSEVDSLDNNILNEKPIISKLDEILTPSMCKNSNNTKKQINDLDTTLKSSSPLTQTNSTDMPYEVIVHSVTEKATRVVCKLCTKELSIRSIDFHMNHCHPGTDVRKVKCELCDTYIMKNKLNRHIMLRHNVGSGSFKCLYCKEEFANKENLTEHVGTCTAKKRKRKANESVRELGECDECHKVMQKASLRMHKAVQHAGLKPVCEHCGRSFGNKFRLQEHYRAKHGYEKFKCSYCDFRSAGASAMRNHERRHRDEKPFVCEECGAKFHAAYLLAQHRQSHRTERLIKCELCPASFKANNSLHMHKLTCHSPARYQCGVCARAYKCRHYAVKHARLAHRHSGPAPPVSAL